MGWKPMSKKSWSWKDYISPNFQAVQESLNGWHDNQKELFLPTVFEAPCKHINQKIETNLQGTLLLSSYPGDDRKVDVSIWLADCWLDKIEVLSYRTEFFNQWGPARKIIYINWPDFGVIESDLYVHLIKYIIYWLKRGKLVQVACRGGHGRTGTLAAGIVAHSEKIGGKEAIREVRKRYCKKAVENQVQEKFVRDCFKERKMKINV